ncbi:hypothetical protein DY000_02026380 [Brassica cretica]|uniref:Uncharacterized protein n=1 Tax=Brassica cretica TaxID=69181 RepID=A0ABQ7EN08_BRACR|nr:hypothetical protein DY000_02026380 [Brassica cretica]
MTDDKTKQKAIVAAADIFGDYYNYFLLVTFNSNSILVCGLQENDLGPWANSCKAKAVSQRSIWTEGQMNCESGAVRLTPY